VASKDPETSKRGTTDKPKRVILTNPQKVEIIRRLASGKN
jgi:hypothetical protein